MERLGPRLPALAWVYGVAGLIPFIGCAGAVILHAPPNQEWWRLALLIYSAVILSFLGGGRWGMELARPLPRNRIITLAMAPSIAAFFLCLAPAADHTLALVGVAAALLLQWFWDARAPGAPQGYARLRSTLTGGAVPSILAAVALGQIR